MICRVATEITADTTVDDSGKTHSELTDVVVCSCCCCYGPTDLGETGIASFFRSHVYNDSCHIDGQWKTPRQTQAWFPKTAAMTIMRSSQAHMLSLDNCLTFRAGYVGILEEDSDNNRVIRYFGRAGVRIVLFDVL